MLLILVSQYIQENHQQREEIGNLTREHHILQNDSYLKERLLTNKTLEYNILKNESLQQKKEQDLLFADRTYQRENEGMKGILHEWLHDLPLFLTLPEALKPNKQAYDMC